MAAQTHKGVSHTLRLSHFKRLERVAYRTKISRSAIVEQAIDMLFNMHPKDATLIDSLHAAGASRREATL